MSLGTRMAATAVRLLAKYGNDYLVNGVNTYKGIETKDTRDLQDKGLVQGDARVFFFNDSIAVGDLITIGTEEWFTTFAETNRLSNVEVITRIVVNK